MMYWIREILGWLLVAIGLVAFGLCYFEFLLKDLVIQAVIFGFVGLTLFRGGLAMLKVAVATRAARDIRREIVAGATPAKQVRPRLGSRQPAGRATKSLLPGPGGRS